MASGVTNRSIHMVTSTPKSARSAAISRSSRGPPRSASISGPEDVEEDRKVGGEVEVHEEPQRRPTAGSRRARAKPSGARQPRAPRSVPNASAGWSRRPASTSREAERRDAATGRSGSLPRGGAVAWRLYTGSRLEACDRLRRMTARRVRLLICRPQLLRPGAVRRGALGAAIRQSSWRPRSIRRSSPRRRAICEAPPDGGEGAGGARGARLSTPGRPPVFDAGDGLGDPAVEGARGDVRFSVRLAGRVGGLLPAARRRRRRHGARARTRAPRTRSAARARTCPRR